MVETALVDWSRLQFALTAGYHWLFVPLTPRFGRDHGNDGDDLCENGR